MFRQALSFPVSGKEGGKTFILGGIAVLGFVVGHAAAVVAVSEIAEALTSGEPVLRLYYAIAGSGAVVGFLCYLLLVGFIPRVLAAAARGQRAVPAFGSVPTLLGNGGRVMAVKAGYLVPGLAIVVVSRLLAVAPLSGTARMVARSAAALSLLAFLLYMVALFYVVPAAVTMFALEENVRAAFDLGRLRDIVGSEDYAVGWVIGVIVIGVGGVVATLLMTVLLGFFAFFHVNVAARYCYGTAVGRALDIHEQTEDVTEPTEELPPDPMAPEIHRRYK